LAITNLSCPHCLVTNRIPAERLTDNPKCGKCKAPLFTGEPMTLDAANAGKVLGNTDIPVLVDCWASWCGPCRSFAPIFAAAAKELEPALRFAKFSTEENEQLAGQWGIRSIPTLILFQGGKEAARVSGALPLNQLKAWLQQQGV
jgi:thioredoxin 2